jgi:signal transduction histidine kinase
MLTVAFALEHEQQGVVARRAAADERLRITRELHDMVAHSLEVIAAEAGAAIKAIDSDPAEARRSIAHISRLSESSLTDMRRLRDMLRDNEATRA